MKTFSHDELIERAKDIKILVRVHTGYQTFKPDWIPDPKGYIYESRTENGKAEWYRPVNL